MAAIAEAGRTIAWVTDDVWRRRSAWPTPRPAGDGGRPGAPPLAASDDAPPALSPSNPASRSSRSVAAARGARSSSSRPPIPAGTRACALRVAAVAAEHALPIGRALARRPGRSRRRLHRIPGPASMRGALVRVLATGAPAIAALEALDQRGLLVRLLPEWAAVRNRPQRNAYHRFTVDRHLLEAAAQAAALASGSTAPTSCSSGRLLHDIGKGFPGDHTDVGVRIVVDDMARRMGFPPEDVAVLTGLVRNHLLLSEVATRRDLDDPATVEAVAAAVEDRDQLELLAALTEADSLATGPAAWGPWKAGLVADLVHRVATTSAGGEVASRHSRRDRPAPRLHAPGRAARSLGRRRRRPNVTVVARDRPGLLSAVTGVFALRGLDVRSADIAGEDGFAVETFVVEPSRGRWPDFELVADELEAVLPGNAPARGTAGRAGPRLRGGPATGVVATGRGARRHRQHGLGRLDGGRGPGRGRRRTAAPHHRGPLRTRPRRGGGPVSTFGHEVVDAFYVRDTVTGGKVDRPGTDRGSATSVVRAIEHRGGPSQARASALTNGVRQMTAKNAGPGPPETAHGQVQFAAEPHVMPEAAHRRRNATPGILG